MDKNMVVRGAKGGQPQPHTPWEMEDNLVSINKIKVLLAVSDGECDGSFSLKDLYLNNVPVQSANGNMNYEGVIAEYRPGTQTQDYIKGFTESASEVVVNRALTTSNPFVFSVTNKSLSAVRIKIAMPRGVDTLENGDMVGVKVEYAVDFAVDGGNYSEVLKDVIDGKTMSGYDRTRRLDLPTPQFSDQVLVRVRRVTADSENARLVDNISVNSYSEVIDAKFRYPLTGLVYVELDSAAFAQMPNISIKKRWKLINVPSNYDVDMREYHGSWDGTFKKAWSNNPAWVLYDLITNQRYGLDQRELGIDVDKWALYEAAQYCDQMVPDGKGGLEPRYLCDVIIQSQVEAYTLIRDICSIFRGMSFWNGESLSVVIDKPRDPVYLFTNDNVIGGSFSRTFASEKSMYTTCNVMFDDEQNMYNQDVEGVFDLDAALRFSHNPTSITAIGCTRRSEANRRGRWILKTNLRSATVNFATGLEGMIPMVGDVIQVSDSAWQSNFALSLSGRLMEVSGLQCFTHFRVDARPGDFIITNKPDGNPVRRTIANVSPDGKTIEVNVGFGFDVQPNAVFAISRQDLALEQYVVTGLTKGDGDEEFTYSVTAVQYDPNKYDAIDYGVNIDDRPTSVIDPDNMQPPENIRVSSYSRIVQGMSVETMVIGWDKAPYAHTYDVQWRKDNGNWINAPRTANTETEIEGIYAGTYHVRVRSISSAQNSSRWSDVVVAGLTGKVGKPNPPTSITASLDEVFGIRVKWGFPAGSEDSAYIELHQSKDGSVDNASLLTMVPYPGHEYWHSILPAGYVNYYRARLVDRIGNVSDWSDFARGMATDDVDAISEVVRIDIENSKAFKELAESTIDNASKIKDQAQTDLQNALANDYNLTWTRKQNGKRKAEYGHAVELIATETEARVAAIEQLKAQIDDDITSQITTIREALADETQARAKAVQELDTKFTKQVGDLETKTNASVSRLDEAISNESQARAQAITQLNAKFESDLNGLKTSTEASITRVDNAIAEEARARASADTALSVRVGNNEAAITQKLDSWIENGQVGVSYVTKLGIKYNGTEYSGGMAQQLVADGGNVKVQTIFDTDRFVIGRIDNGSIRQMPFFTEGNQVFMNSVIIKDGSITNAKIGEVISSNNWDGGYNGWAITKSGYAIFNNVTVRGTIEAQQGNFSMTNSGKGVTINGNGVTIALTNGGRIVLGEW